MLNSILRALADRDNGFDSSDSDSEEELIRGALELTLRHETHRNLFSPVMRLFFGSLLTPTLFARNFCLAFSLSNTKNKQ